jgi:glycosyltransferase involved in cell wall biosynthesis
VIARVCFVGGGRYSNPLDNTSEKKFRALKSLTDIFVIGFSRNLKFQCFYQNARFYLLPQFPLAVLRYLQLLVLGPLLLFWLVIRHRVQIVIAQSPYEGFIAALALKIVRWLGYRVRLVVETHGDFENSLFSQRKIPFPQLYRFVMTRAANYSLKEADLLRAVSNFTAKQIRDRAGSKKIVQFPAWTDIGTFQNVDGEANSNTSPLILYVGVLTPLKGVHHLLNALNHIIGESPAARLVIIGKDENREYAEVLKRQCEKLGLNGRVQFLSPQPQSKLAIWMRRASVFVLPSMSEGLPRVVIEAMASGTPVIGTRVGGIPELVADGITGWLVRPGDEDGLADRLRWILTHQDEARAMGERGRSLAGQLFSTDSYMDGYRQIFELCKVESEQQEHASSPLQSRN